MTITSSNFAKALWPGVNAWYGKAYNEYKTEWDRLFTTYKSSRRYEEDVGTSGFGLALAKAEGAGITYDSEKQGFTTRYPNVTYALGFVVTREAWEDDQYDVVASRKAQGLAFSMRQTKEVIAASVFNNAFNTSYTGGDGSTLIACASAGSASHPNVAGGTWTNGPATDVDLSEAALEAAVIAIGNFTNDRGLRIAVRPTKLVIPINSMFESTRILDSTLQPGISPGATTGGGLNDTNALRQMGMINEVVVNHYLTDTDAWFVLTDVPHGLKHFERRADSFDMDNDFDTENAKFKASARYAFGWTDPRCIYGSEGA